MNAAALKTQYFERSPLLSKFSPCNSFCCNKTTKVICHCSTLSDSQFSNFSKLQAVQNHRLQNALGILEDSVDFIVDSS